MTAATDIQISNDCDSGHSLQRMVGRSLPSRKYGVWIVAEVRGNIEGRSRLVTGNLKGEQWVWTRSLVAMLAELDAPNNQAHPRCGRTRTMNTPTTQPPASLGAAPCSPDWRSIADDLAAALERLDALYRSEQDPEAPINRPEWLRYPWQRYHRALADSANGELSSGGQAK